MADIFLGDDDDVEVGTQDADSIRGGGGDDDLNGLGGDDGLDGGDGDDRLRGGSGNDTIVGGGNGADSLEGGSGDDDLDGANNDDTLIGGTGADDLAGGTGADLLRGGDDDDTLEGGGDGDAVFGGGEDDRIIWRAGDGEDEIDGGDGDDTLEATGFDTEDGLFSLAEEDGGRLVFELRERTVSPPFPLDARLDDLENLEFVELLGGTGDDSFSLGAIAAGSLVSVRISGRAGDDSVFSGGDPVDPNRNEAPIDFFGGIGEDFALGSFGDDTLDGGFDDDRLNGEAGNDLLIGDNGNDELDGGFNGMDTLDGGNGSDQLTGGARDGPDTFRFAFGVAQGVDNITDFETEDRIEIRGATQDQLDSNDDGVLDDADDAVFAGFGTLQINGLFPLTGTLRVSGFGGAAVDSLVIGDDVFFLV